MASLFDLLNSLDDIDDLIASGQRESETLEYKDASSRLQSSDHGELGKDVSAFANTLGGVIVYGVATNGKDDTLPSRRVAIDPKNIGTIQRVIASGIRPVLERPRTKAIPSTGSPECFLVEVPQSSLGPHQAVHSQRYYRRNGPHSEPMTHDLVELHFSRRIGPKLLVTLSLSNHPHANSSRPPFLGPYVLGVALRNEGQRVARDIQMYLRFRSDGVALSRDDGVFVDAITSEFPILNDRLVVYPEQRVSFWELGFSIERSLVIAQEQLLTLTLYADEMRRVRLRGFLRYRTDGSGEVELVTEALE